MFSDIDTKLLITNCFDWKFYTTYYQDLSHFNEDGAKNHYITYGYKEGRICYDNSKTKLIIVGSCLNDVYLQSKYIKFLNYNIETKFAHEFNSSRLELLNMLSNGKILIDTDIILTSSERKFLYSNIFKNIISYEQLIDNEIYYKDLNIVYLCLMTNWNFIANTNSYRRSDGFDQSLYNPAICKYVLSIDYIDDIAHMYDISNRFVLIHFRAGVSTPGNDTFENIDSIINIFKKSKLKIFIFVNKDYTDHFIDMNIDIINYNIQEYCSLMNHYNCIYVISCFSGAGIISQYCCNSNVIMYPTHPVWNYILTNKVDITNNWDYNKFSKVNNYYLSIQDIINYMEKSDFDPIKFKELYATIYKNRN